MARMHKYQLSTTAQLLGLTALALRIRAEDKAQYRYEDYQEDGGRVRIQTHGLYVEKQVVPWLSLKGSYIYDGISGATPLGAPPIPGESSVVKSTIEDIRRAESFEPSFKIGNNTLSPQVSYSKESDYESWGVAFTHAIDLNAKNTTVRWGISHDFDRVLPNPGEAISFIEHKDTTDLLAGITQILTPTSLVSLDLTFGYSDGYLNDPYKRVLFTDFPYNPGQPYTVFPELRPSHKFREVAMLAYRNFFTQADGALEASYRFHHDDWGIIANTFTLEWHQKLGTHFILSPLLRYHHQTAADFYATSFAGDPTCPPEIEDCPQIPIPSYYSSDYRLSTLQTITMGMSASIKLQEHLSIELAFKRYLMTGLDHQTAQDQYPQANVFSAGLTLWF